ncbi:MAG: hypothetical protein JWM80_366, partial [Cyanobacteria bacterium RYN_339]|nr:hypothetical protein [Cyanobacteria bacterium RYN_339]
AVAAAPTTYTVQHGDSLSKIARAMGGSAEHWHQLYEMNHATVGGNPNMIHPGLVLQLPPAWNQQAAAPHTVHVQVSAAPPPPAPVAVEAPVMVEAPGLDSESPNIEGVASAPLMEKPTDVHQAQEQIERMSLVHNGGSDAITAMQDALKMLPKDSPDYEHFRKTVDTFEATNRPAAAPTLETPAVEAPANAQPSPAATPVSAAPEPVTVAALPPHADDAPAANVPTVAAAAPTPTPAPQGELPEDPDGPPVGFY